MGVCFECRIGREKTEGHDTGSTGTAMEHRITAIGWCRTVVITAIHALAVITIHALGSVRGRLLGSMHIARRNPHGLRRKQHENGQKHVFHRTIIHLNNFLQGHINHFERPRRCTRSDKSSYLPARVQYRHRPADPGSGQALGQVYFDFPFLRPRNHRTRPLTERKPSVKASRS